MNSSDPLYPFRLALSYLERVEEELLKWEELRAARKTEVTTFDHVRSGYQAHCRRAGKAVEEFRARAREEIGPLEEELRLQKRARKKLVEHASAGEVPPEEANARSRELASRIGDIETRLETAHAIGEAGTADDVGGFVPLPIEEYEKRLVSPEPVEVTKSRDFGSPGVWIAFLAAAALVVIAGYVFVAKGEAAKPVFEARVLESDPAIIRVTARNEGGRPLEVYVPWPEGNPRAPGLPSSSYGILVYALERDGNTAKLVPNSEGCWRYRGVYLVDSGPITVRPRLAAELLLDTHKLGEFGIEASVIRLVFTRRGGSEVGHFETVLE